MKKRRRLASITAAIAQLAVPPPAPPLVTTPDCTTSPRCGRCWFCLVREHGPDFWVRGIR